MRRGICFAFQRGECTRGDACRFAHGNIDEKSDEVCPEVPSGKRARGRLARAQLLRQNKKQRLSTGEGEGGEETIVDIRDSVTPLWQKPYSEQLTLKQTAMQRVLKSVSRKVRKAEPILGR